MVELWSSAETGTGAAIAPGSHDCTGNWADFVIAAATRKIAGTAMDADENDSRESPL